MMLLVLTVAPPIELLLKPVSESSFRPTACLYLLPMFTPTCTVRPKFNSWRLPLPLSSTNGDSTLLCSRSKV